jgi:S-adenosylmethionine/arginine decarboxylase-like enzyme
MVERMSAGLHITMDAYVDNPSVFTRERLEQLFGKLVSALEMTALDKAMVYEVPCDPKVLERVKKTGKFEDEGGITSIQVISTSHLSLHAWPLQSFFSLDAFSCKDFNSELALSIIRETLGVVAEETNVIKRRKPVPGSRARVVAHLGE